MREIETTKYKRFTSFYGHLGEQYPYFFIEGNSNDDMIKLTDAFNSLLVEMKDIDALCAILLTMRDDIEQERKRING